MAALGSYLKVPKISSTRQSLAEYIPKMDGEQQKFFSNRKEYFNAKSSSTHISRLNGTDAVVGHVRNDSFTNQRNENNTVDNTISAITSKTRAGGGNTTFSTWGGTNKGGIPKDRPDVSFLQEKAQPIYP